MLFTGKQKHDAALRVARMEEWLAASQREHERLETDNTRLRAEVEYLRTALDRREDDLRRMTDAALRAGGSAPAYFPAPPQPDPGEARPIRRLRDWRREMELLEAQAFARRQRGEPDIVEAVE